MQTFLKPRLLTRFIRHTLAPLALAAGLGFPAVATAQGLFSPAVTVNDRVITNYELEQRALLMELLRAPGESSETALRELIDERLRAHALAEAGIEVTEEGVQVGIEEFAGRANLTPEEFLKALQENGVSPETFRDFVSVGIGWRELVGSRFLGRARPSEKEIDQALGQSGGTSVQILLAELIMPVTQQNIQQVEEIAEQVQQITKYDAFSAAATQFSASPTREKGGSLGWMSLNRLPPALRPMLLDMKKGEVTSPVRLQNALALFQFRGIRETTASAPRYAAIEYATYHIPGGRTPEALSVAKSVADRVDTCDDLYGIAKDQPAEVLDRQSLAPSDIPGDIAIELAKLDTGEISTTLTRNNGQTLLFLMMCGRTGELSEDATREEIVQALTQQRLSTFAEAYLDQLRAEAIIVEK
jgi:peptidyl-prolyl cis-trans isomerase SurA